MRWIRRKSRPSRTADDSSRVDPLGSRQKAALEKAGWHIESVSYGMAPLLGGEALPAVEIVAFRQLSDDMHRRLRLVGWARGGDDPREEFWQLGPASRSVSPYGTTAVKRFYLLAHSDSGLAAQVDMHIRLARDVRMDVDSVLGNPVATVSVFTLTGAFLAAMAARAAEDAYRVLCRLLSRATPITREGAAAGGPWAVVHDVEHNCVVECPKEIPAEAAIRLAQLAREGQLSRTHVRWEPENGTWLTVGSLNGAPPSLPPEEGAPAE